MIVNQRLTAERNLSPADSVHFEAAALWVPAFSSPLHWIASAHKRFAGAARTGGSRIVRAGLQPASGEPGL